MTRRGQHGLSMIEVLAAMVIFSAGAVVLFGWIGQAADRMARLSVEQKQLFAELAAIEFAKSLNPMLQPSGTITVADTEIRWQATAVGIERMARNAAGSEGAYMVQLYQVKLEALAPGDVRAERGLMLAGWRQTRPIRQSNPFGELPASARPGTSTPPPPGTGATLGR